MPITPTRIAQIAINVRDITRATQFYRDTLGLTHLFDAPPKLVFFQCGEVRLMLSEPEASAPLGSAILYYAVPNAAEAQHALQAAGVDFIEPAHCIAHLADRQVWLATCHDSEGNIIGLMSERASVPTAGTL